MKIVTWNCNGAFRTKYQYLEKYDADIVIIQECENPATVPLSKMHTNYHNFVKNSIWHGDNKNKGLGVFASDNINLEKLEFNHIHHGKSLQWFIPIKAISVDNTQNPFNIIAVWNHHNNAKAFKYIGQFWLFMQNNLQKFDNTIICGDFNSNSMWDSWDRWWNHTDCVNELSKKNIHSIYHSLNSIKHGTEIEHTFFMHRNHAKPYHIDYIFAHNQYLKSTKNFEIGIFEDWSDKSDHMPIVWEFDLMNR